jgi:hypothetical protein
MELFDLHWLSKPSHFHYYWVPLCPQLRRLQCMDTGKKFPVSKEDSTVSSPSHQFIEDLTQFIKDKQQQGHDIIVAMDANEVIGEDTNGLSKLMHDCGLYDLMDLPGTDASAQLMDTFCRGSNRQIDYILGTERLLQSVCRRGALAFNDGIVSDHRGLFLDFDPTILYGGAVADTVSMSSRRFTSKNAKKVTKYVDLLEQYWIDHKIKAQITHLTDEANSLPKLELRRYNAIDHNITQGMLAAKKKVRHADQKYHWSKALDHSSRLLCMVLENLTV